MPTHVDRELALAMRRRSTSTCAVAPIAARSRRRCKRCARRVGARDALSRAGGTRRAHRRRGRGAGRPGVRRAVLARLGTGAAATAALALVLGIGIDADTAVARRPARRRSGGQPRALAAGRARRRCRVVGPAHRQAVVQRQARLRRAGAGLRGGGLRARRRPPRLFRQPSRRRARLPAPAAHDQRVRRCRRRKAQVADRRAHAHIARDLRSSTGRRTAWRIWAVSDADAATVAQLASLLGAGTAAADRAARRPATGLGTTMAASLCGRHDARPAHALSGSLEASRHRHVDLQRDVGARAETRRGESGPGLSRLRDRSGADRPRHRGDARRPQPVSAVARRHGVARSDRGQGRRACTAAPTIRTPKSR